MVSALTYYELTERAGRVFTAGFPSSLRLEASSFTLKSTLGQIPLIGDEMEFPEITGKTIFKVIARRFRLIDARNQEMVLTLMLDLAESAFGPADAA
jgi:hypothetical protein